MILPSGVSEAQFLDAAQKAAAMLSRKFKFGYYDAEDIHQEALVEAIKLMAGGKYDASRSLPAFIYTHMRNRLINLTRDKLKRAEVPCVRCANGVFHGKRREPCDTHLRWVKRNSDKRNIMCPTDISYIDDSDEDNTRTESDILDQLECKELLARIDENLDVSLRETYLLMRNGSKVPKNKRVAVQNAVRKILAAGASSGGQSQ